MARINLLPWREQQRKERQKQFVFYAIGGAALMLAIIAYIHVHIGREIEHQEARNRFLQNQIAQVDKEIKEIKELETTKAKLLARMDIIQQLQRSRPLEVHLFDDLARTLPDGLYLTEVTQQGTALTLKGVAQSNARVSAYMRNVEASQWLGNPRLEVIKTTQEGSARRSDFILRANQLGVQEDINEEPKPKK